MWNPFGKRVTVKSRRSRRVTPDSLDLTLKKIATNEAVRQLRTADEETKRQFVSQYSGFTMIPKQDKSVDQLVDEILSSRPEYLEALVSAKIKAAQEKTDPTKDLAGTINDLALQKLRENPGLADELVAQRVVDMLNQGGSTDPFDKMATTLESFERFKEKLGVSDDNKNWWQGVLVQTLGTVLPQLLGGRGQQFPMLAQGMPEIGGVGTVTMVEERLPAPKVDKTEEPNPTFRRKINVIGLSPAEEAGRVSEPTPGFASAAPPEAPAESQPPSGQLNLTEWAPYLDGEPGDFVRALMERVQFGEPQAVFAVQLILSFSDAQSLLAALAPHKAGAPLQVQDVITRLEAKRDWVDEAMRLLRERQT